MNLEIIMLGEVIKGKYCMISHSCRILKKKKKDTNKLTYKTETNSDLENKPKVTREEG